MPIPITMPALSPTMTTGHLIVWHKRVNDVVNTGDLLLEIETDKAVMEVEATQSGILDYLAVPAGTNDVAVGTIIAALRHQTELEGVSKTWLLEQGIENSTVPVVASPAPLDQPSPAQPIQSATVQPAGVSLSSTLIKDEKSTSSAGHLNTSPDSGASTNANGFNGQASAKPDSTVAPVHISRDHNRVMASPLARKWAEQHGISLHHIHGTGPRGRIVKNDVMEAMKHGTVDQRNGTLENHNGDIKGISSPIHVSSCSVPLLERAVDTGLGALDPAYGERCDYIVASTTPVSLSGMRKTIAQRLTLSKQTVPHFYLTVQCHMDALLALRQAMNGDSKGLSVNDFMVRACALSLRKVNEMRLMWGDEQHAVQHDHVDLAVAVSVPGGLITPIVRFADTKPLRTLAPELKSLIVRARNGKLSPNEYQGGLFTLTNLGMMGIDQFNPIINPGHTGILAIGATKEQAIVRDGAVTVGKVMQATIAADHRVIDGSVAAEFLTTFQKLIEQPLLLVS
ncbi:MAG: 2-oxo acid dehydrogenase subunit E2 [Alphaproteobacteria bacterium]|nr:2-oxo acid dehydrogenase subunit E2 [Alphaproteobacteria bacterium]